MTMCLYVSLFGRSQTEFLATPVRSDPCNDKLITYFGSILCFYNDDGIQQFNFDISGKKFYQKLFEIKNLEQKLRH